MPNFKPNPDGMKPSGFKMKNSALHMSAKTGSPMQNNYNPSPVKAIPIIAAIGAKLAAAAAKAKTLIAAAKATKAGAAVVKGAKTAKAAYAKGGVVKTVVDTATESAVSNIMTPRENEETASITGNQKSIM